MDQDRQTETETKFISTISHKLRTPLNAIMGFSELLLDQAYGPLNEKQAHYLRNINVSGKNLLTLLEDLIDLMNLRWGDRELHLAEFSLPRAVQEICLAAGTAASSKDITFSISNHQGISEVKADEAKLTKIIQHLVMNALRFTPEGGKVEVALRLSSHPPAQLAGAQALQFLEVSIADTGVGIKPEDQERIFSEFYQVPATNTPDHKGTGLGLTIARELVRLQEGAIWVESTEGRGSIFIFAIPLHSTHS